MKITNSARATGFTLVELLIVVVIVGILAAVALPSYRNHAIETARTAAVADLQELTLVLERAFSAQGRYDNVASPGNLVNPLPYNNSPQNDANVKYGLSLSALNATTFTLIATPVGGQTEDATCGELQLDETGVQCILAGTVCSDSADAAERAAVQSCW